MPIFRPARLAAISALAAIGLTIGAGVASAHVSVNPDTAVAGNYPTLTFQIPNESAKASTVKVTIDFPMDHPFASVSVRKQPGWTATTTTQKLTTPISDDDNASITQAVSSITWTSDSSGSISLGQFAQFAVSVGPVPKVASMAFGAIQTYSDGSVVRWDEPTPASGVEPENPAPVLTVSAAETTAAAPATGSAAAGVSAAAPPTTGVGRTVTVTAAPQVAVAAVGGDDNAARTLGVIGIIVGAVGLLVAAVALRGRPKVRS